MYCQNCKNKFDRQIRVPFVICPMQHLLCYICIQQKSFKSQFLYCHICQQFFLYSKIAKFRLFQKFEEKVNLIKIQKNNDISKTKDILSHTFNNILNLKFNRSNKQLKKLMIKNAKECIKRDKFIIAINILKKIIENDIQGSMRDSFIGLGLIEETLGFCEKRKYGWYCSYYGEDNLSLYDLLNICYLNQRNDEEQKLWYKKISLEYPFNYRSLFGLAITEHNSGNLQTALKLYYEVANMNQEFKKSFTFIAFIEYQQQNYDKAYDIVSKNLEQKSFLSHFIKVVSEKPKNFQIVIKQLQSLQNQFPSNSKIISAIGDYYFHEQKYEQAEKFYKNACEINCNYISCFIKWATILTFLKNYSQAIQLLHQVLENGNLQICDKSMCYFILGLANKFSKKYKIAAKWFQASISINLSNLQAYIHLVKVYRVLSKYKQAIDACKNYIKIAKKQDPHLWSMYQCIMHSYCQLNDKKAVIQWLQNWIKSYPQDLEIYFEGGKIYVKLGMLQESLQYLQKCFYQKYQIYQMFLLLINIYTVLGYKDRSVRLIDFFMKSFQLELDDAQLLLKIKRRLQNGQSINIIECLEWFQI